MVLRDAPAARRYRGLFLVFSLVMVLASRVDSRAQGPQVTPFQWLGPVPAGASISVENPWGDVRLRPGDPSGKLEVLASLQPGGAPAAVPDVEVKALGQVVTVRVAASGAAGQRADLVLFVPGRTAITVRTTDGAIEAKKLRGDATLTSERGEIVAKGVTGDLCATSVSGSVTAELETAPGRAQSLESRTGDLTAYLWEDASVTVEAATSGEISTDFTLQVEYRKFEEPNKRAIAVLGDGGARLKVQSKRGRVRLLRLPRSFQKEGSDAPKPTADHP